MNYSLEVDVFQTNGCVKCSPRRGHVLQLLVVLYPAGTYIGGVLRNEVLIIMC